MKKSYQRLIISCLLISAFIFLCGVGPCERGYTISGTVSDYVQSGVTVTLSGDNSDTATTDSYGNYIFTGLDNGSYTVTPSFSGYAFLPTSQSVTVSGVNETEIDFYSVPDDRDGYGTIYGYITDYYTGMGIYNAQIFSDSGIFVRSDHSGFYSMVHMVGNVQLTVRSGGYDPHYRPLYLEDLAIVEENFILTSDGDHAPNPSTCFLEEILGMRSHEVKILKCFRDNILKKNNVGREIIVQYYRLSPVLNDLLKDNNLIKRNIKQVICLLVPFIEEMLE